MIKAKPSFLGRFFWKTFSSLSFKFSFRKMHIKGDLIIDDNESILLIGNHISWWDGFWPLLLNAKLWQRAYFVMMLEKELEKRMFMRQGGAFSIQPGSRTIIQTIKYAVELLGQKGNMVLIYPQGSIRSQYETEINFQPGIMKILQLMKSEIHIIFFASFVEYGSHPKPTLFFELKKLRKEDILDVNESYSVFYQQARAKHIADMNNGMLC